VGKAVVAPDDLSTDLKWPWRYTPQRKAVSPSFSAERILAPGPEEGLDATARYVQRRERARASNEEELRRGHAVKPTDSPVELFIPGAQAVRGAAIARNTAARAAPQQAIEKGFKLPPLVPTPPGVIKRNPVVGALTPDVPVNAVTGETVQKMQKYRAIPADAGEEVLAASKQQRTLKDSVNGIEVKLREDPFLGPLDRARLTEQRDTFLRQIDELDRQMDSSIRGSAAGRGTQTIPSNQIAGPPKPTTPAQSTLPPTAAAPTPPITGSTVNAAVPGTPPSLPKLVTPQMAADQNLVPLVPAPTTTAGAPRGVGRPYVVDPTKARQVGNVSPSPTATAGQAVNSAATVADDIVDLTVARNPLYLGRSFSKYIPGRAGRFVSGVLDHVNPFNVPLNIAAAAEGYLRSALPGLSVERRAALSQAARGHTLAAFTGGVTGSGLPLVADLVKEPASGTNLGGFGEWAYADNPVAQTRLRSVGASSGLTDDSPIEGNLEDAILKHLGISAFTRRGPSNSIIPAVDAQGRPINIRGKYRNELPEGVSLPQNAANLGQQAARNVVQPFARLIDAVIDLAYKPNVRFQVDMAPVSDRINADTAALADLHNALRTGDVAAIKNSPVTSVPSNSTTALEALALQEGARHSLAQVSSILGNLGSQDGAVAESAQKDLYAIFDKLSESAEFMPPNMRENLAQELYKKMPEDPEAHSRVMTRLKAMLDRKDANGIEFRDKVRPWITPAVLDSMLTRSPSPLFSETQKSVGVTLRGDPTPPGVAAASHTAFFGPAVAPVAVNTQKVDNQVSTGASPMPTSDLQQPPSLIPPASEMKSVPGAAPPTADNSSAVYNSPEAQAIRQRGSKLISQGVEGVSRILSPFAPSTEPLPVLPKSDGGLLPLPIKLPAGAPAPILPATTSPAPAPVTTGVTTQPLPAATTQPLPAAVTPLAPPAPPVDLVDRRAPREKDAPTDMRPIDSKLSPPPPPAPVTFTEEQRKQLADITKKLNQTNKNTLENMQAGLVGKPIVELLNTKGVDVKNEELTQFIIDKGLSPEAVIQDLSAQLNLPPDLAKSYWGSLSSDSQTLLMMGVGMSTISLLWSMFGGGGGGKDDEDEEGGSSFLKQALMFLGLAAAGWGGLGGTFSKMPEFERLSRGKEMWKGIQNSLSGAVPTSKSPSSKP
jgi:hypothetical protein